MCRRNLRRTKIVDSSGLELTGGALLTATLALRRLLRRQVLAADETHVGILLPPSVGAVLSNTALTLDRRIPVNLNYTVTSEVINASMAQCGIRHVLTSRRMLDRFPLKLDAELVYVEELKQRMTWSDKLLAAAAAWLLPAAVLERLLGITAVRPDDVATVMFTSGSTGLPKGVMLTYANIGANLQGIDSLIHLRRSDALLGVLPMFHSFGYTATLWTVLTLRPQGRLPLHAAGTAADRRALPQARLHDPDCHAHVSAGLSAALRARGAAFAGRRLCRRGKAPARVGGRLPRAVRRAAGRRLRGHGVVAGRVRKSAAQPPPASGYPAGGHWTPGKCGNRIGTIGQPMAGIDVKVIDVDTGEDLPRGRQGMLLVRGPSVMKGYLNRPDLTAEVMRGDWYVTGDLATLDEDNYISITGRISRFSKIGGEMVPHLRVEAAVREVLPAGDQEVQLAVTAVHDPTRGERIVVLHTGLGMPAAEICRQMAARGLPRLWIPSPDSFRQVASIPQLGTGKLDMSRLKEMALREFSPEGARHDSPGYSPGTDGKAQ